MIKFRSETINDCLLKLFNTLLIFRHSKIRKIQIFNQTNFSTWRESKYSSYLTPKATAQRKDICTEERHKQLTPQTTSELWRHFQICKNFPTRFNAQLIAKWTKLINAACGDVFIEGKFFVIKTKCLRV